MEAWASFIRMVFGVGYSNRERVRLEVGERGWDGGGRGGW